MSQAAPRSPRPRAPSLVGYGGISLSARVCGRRSHAIPEAAGADVDDADGGLAGAARDAPQATAEVLDRETLGQCDAVEGDLPAAGIAEPQDGERPCGEVVEGVGGCAHDVSVAVDRLGT